MDEVADNSVVDGVYDETLDYQRQAYLQWMRLQKRGEPDKDDE